MQQSVAGPPFRPTDHGILYGLHPLSSALYTDIETGRQTDTRDNSQKPTIARHFNAALCLLKPDKLCKILSFGQFHYQYIQLHNCLHLSIITKSLIEISRTARDIKSFRIS